MPEHKPSRKSILGSMSSGLGGSSGSRNASGAAAGGSSIRSASSAAAAPRLTAELAASSRSREPSDAGTDAQYRNHAAQPSAAASSELERPEGEEDLEVPDYEEEIEDDEDVSPSNGGPTKDAAALIDEEQRAADQRAASEQKAAQETRARRAGRVRRLTSEQRHYLLKALVSLQMQAEWSELEKLGALTQYGYPFALERPQLKRVKNDLDMDSEFAKGEFAAGADDPYADEDAARRAEKLAEPLILRHMFQVHLRPFPGLDEAPLKYWQKRIQPYFDETAARNFSTSMERGEITSRRFYTLAFTRYLGGFFARGFGVRGEGELRGPGRGEPGSEKWGVGKQWGKGTVKRGLDKPARIDDKLMARIDALFEGEEGKVWRLAGKETARVRKDWQAFKEMNIETETGLEDTMAYLQVSNIKNLPPRFRNAEEWARMHAAYIFHTLFVTSPAADSIFDVVKGVHTLFPYWGARQLLRVANAQTMIQGILSLLLARPAGSKSLVQRIFTYVLGKEASAIGKDYIVPLRKMIDDAELTKKIEEYVKRASRPEGRAIRSRAERTGEDVLTTILLYSSGSQLSQSKQQHVLEMQRAFAASPYLTNLNLAYPPKSPMGKLHAGEPSNWNASSTVAADARKFAQLRLHLRECLKKRDREQTVAMASGALIPSILKDSLEVVFYQTIRQVAEVADLAARLGDLQNFIDDLIKMKKKKDDSLQAYIALCARHENSLYMLFSECHTIAEPFTRWLQAGADYMAMGTTDPYHPANRKAKKIEVDLEELLQDDSLTDADVDAVLKETDRLAEYVRWQKVWYELEMRKNFLLARPDAAPASGLTEDDIPKGPMRQEIQELDSLMRILLEQEGMPVEDGTVRTEARGSEMAEFPWAYFSSLDPLHQHLRPEGGQEPQLFFEPKMASAPVPEFAALRKVMPAFQHALRECLPRWREGDARGPPKDAGLTASAAAPKDSAPPSIAEKQAPEPKKGGLGGLFRKK